MQNIDSSDLKTILHSKRANIYYLEHCRLLVNAGRVEYVTEQGSSSLYFNIPIANTTVILLGTGTSLTQASMRELAKAGVLVGFCGGGGTPLFSANDVDFDVAWFLPQSEYRPTEYLQKWVKFWFDDSARLEAGRDLQLIRIKHIRQIWFKFFSKEIYIESTKIDKVLCNYEQEFAKATSHDALLTTEGRLTKCLYKEMAQATKINDFVRIGQGKGTDNVNKFLDHGNYLAYGLGATATWVLGLPHGLSILHGKTRRGGLVFDVADLIKDAVVLPQAFISAMLGDEEQEFRQTCIKNFLSNEILDMMIDDIKEILYKRVGD